MTDDFFLIDIPIFVPKYDEKKQYGWSKYKEETKQLLSDTTGGYCMYCYDTIVINGKQTGQIEHGIEKVNMPEYLTNCVPNLGIACGSCNGMYKRRGETKRKLSKESIEKFKKTDCLNHECKGFCTEFREIRQQYIKQGGILIQPFKAQSESNGKILRMQYDLLQGKYIPAVLEERYNAEETKIIESHIKLFGLNTAERKNREVARYCKNVIDNQSILKDIEYNNLIVDLFRNKLLQVDEDKAMKVCQLVYTKAFMTLSS